MASEQQVQEVRRRFVESLQPKEVDTLVAITSLPRSVVCDALLLFAGTLLPPVSVHSVWIEWSKVMAYTGTSEKVSFLHYAQGKARQWQQEGRACARRENS